MKKYYEQPTLTLVKTLQDVITASVTGEDMYVFSQENPWNVFVS